MGPAPAGTLGERAERHALSFLISKGLRPVARNFRCRGGEIDLIMLDGDCLTFIEVRFRNSTRFTSPAPTVDYRKQRKIVRTAAMFLARQRRFANRTVRFDVVAISGDRSTPVEWIRDAFRPGDSSM